jgi:antibiotic biosynthesis monooxygenase (ABM) superfamily enzyme
VTDPGDQPVTAVVTRRVKPGCETAYEAWLAQLQHDARDLPGYLGVTTQRPAAAGPREYVSVIRFRRIEDLRAFEASPLRLDALRRVAPLVDADAVWQTMTGLEFWFTPPAGTVVPVPSRGRMALLMIGVVFGLVLSIGTVVNLAADRLPFPLPAPVRLLTTISLEVLLMTYWLMPRLTRALAGWIYPARTTVR